MRLGAERKGGEEDEVGIEKKIHATTGSRQGRGRCAKAMGTGKQATPGAAAD